MGTPVPSSSLFLPSVHSPLDHWFSPFPSSASSSSSSSPSPQPSSLLPCIPFDGSFHLPAHATPFSPADSPVISSNSASKDIPQSPFNSNYSSLSAMSNFSIPTSHPSSDVSIPRLPSFQVGFNPIPKPGQQDNTPSRTISSLLTSGEPASAAGAGLTAARSTGAGATKVSKRRARISNKAPIAILSADTANFRAMVQQLTGIPPSHVAPQIWGTTGAPLLRPQPTRFTYNGGLPKGLDASASCLGHKHIIFPFLQRAQEPLIDGGACNNAAEQILFQGRDNYDTLASSYKSLPGLWDATCNSTPSAGHVKANSASNVPRECEQPFSRQTANLFDNLLMLDDDVCAKSPFNADVHAKSPFNAVDAWLACDGGLANHSPRVDLAKIESGSSDHPVFSSMGYP